MSEEMDLHYRLFQALHGGLATGDPILVGQIPKRVQQRLGWHAKEVFLTNRDTQKIRFHPAHGMDAIRGQNLPLVISSGDYYQQTTRGSQLQIQVVLHEPDTPKRAYYLVLARDEADRAIFLRTFFFDAALSRNKMKKAIILRKRSNVCHFVEK